MAQTPNLKLNLFNGSDRPNYELFNDNNQKIDEVLVNAKTHNHDGTNSAQIKATSVIFDKNDTTLNANNLEDAVKEVFTEADSKITWITNAIGKTSSSVSNPDIKVDEIKADFDAAREKYLANIKNYTLFNIKGSQVSSTSPIKDVKEAINNTVFKEATATKDDMLAEARGITKGGTVESGTISSVDYLTIRPNTYNSSTVSKDMYKQLYLQPFPVENPALHIKKGCTILGIEGMLSEHGSNGWDIGDNILKSKLSNHDTNFIAEKGAGAASYASIPYPVTMKNNNNIYVDVQHFRLNGQNILCYTPDMKEYFSLAIPDLESGTTTPIRNPITNKSLFKMFHQQDCLYAAIASKTKVYIVNLYTKTVSYKYPASGSNLPAISEILIPKSQEPTFNICFIGENGHISCQPVYNALGTAVEKWKGVARFHGSNYKYTKETNGAIASYFKETETEEQTSSFSTKVYKIKSSIEDGTITLVAGDKFSILSYLRGHSDIELIYSIPFGGAATTFNVLNDDDSILDIIQTTSSASTVKTIYLRGSTDLTIQCVTGVIKITGIRIVEAGNANRVNKLFSQDWGYLNGATIINQVEVSGRIDEAYALFGGHEKNLDEGKCSAIYSLVKFDGLAPISATSFFDLGPKLIVEDMFVGKDVNIDSLKTHRCLSHMSEYDNYIYGTFPDMRYMYSTVSATGTRYHIFNRRLIKLDFRYSNYRGKAVLSESTKAREYRLFRVMYIDYKGQAMGLEQSCTLEAFVYYCKLNGKLQGTEQFVDWSEDYYRTAEEEFKILDDGNTLNQIRMIQGVTRLYNTNGTLSNTKIVGTVIKATKEIQRGTQASMSSTITDSNYSYTPGMLSIYNTTYKINDVKE